MKYALSLVVAGFAALTVSAQDKPAEKITYVDHVRPLLENKCFS